MASLELIPKVPVLLVQTGVFLAAFVVVKKLFAEPYMAVRERRHKLTIGGKADAAQSLAKCETLSQKINDRLIDAAGKAKQQRDEIRAAAMAKRQTHVAAAEADARKIVDDVAKQLAKDLAVEKAKVPAIVASLTGEVYQAALA